jgi:hypothetical protein
MNSQHITTANTIYIDIVRQRWGYSVTGTGHIAVVFHCRHHVELVGHALAARQLIAARCGVVCRAGSGERCHVAYDLNTPPPVTPRPSFNKLPGWDD